MGRHYNVLHRQAPPSLKVPYPEQLTARQHEPIDCAHYSACLSEVALVKHTRIKVVPCEGCSRYTQAKPVPYKGWQRRGWEPTPGV